VPRTFSAPSQASSPRPSGRWLHLRVRLRGRARLLRPAARKAAPAKRKAAKKKAARR